MTDSFPALSRVRTTEDDAAREVRHQALATLLGAYADSELPIETSSQIDAHLLGCARCRNELDVQQSVRLRLSRNTLPIANSELQQRVRQAISATPVPATAKSVAPRQFTRVLLYAVAFALVVASIAVTMVWRNAPPQARYAPLEVDTSIPVITSVFDEYQRVVKGDLPGRARDLESVRGALPFAVTPLHDQSAHLLAAWTTTLNSEPAAVLAYRWKESVILQFVVDEALMLRAHELRKAFASGRVIVAQQNEIGLVAWSEQSAGSVVIGEGSWATLSLVSRSRGR